MSVIAHFPGCHPGRPSRLRWLWARRLWVRFPREPTSQRSLPALLHAGRYAKPLNRGTARR